MGAESFSYVPVRAKRSRLAPAFEARLCESQKKLWWYAIC